LTQNATFGVASAGGDGRVALSWQALATVTAVSSNSNPATLGTSPTLTATVARASGGTTPTGTVQFYVNNQPIGGAINLTKGQAAILYGVASPPPVGSYTMSAVYSGDASFQASTGGLIETVTRIATTITVASSSNPAIPRQNVTFTSTVAPNPDRGYGLPTGTVRWAVDGQILSNTTLTNGQTTYSTSSLSPGSHTVLVLYRGDANYAQSPGGLVVQSPLAIHAGGPTVANFVADEDFTGGKTAAVTNAISIAGVSNAAPATVYQTRRFGQTFTYTISGLLANATYTVRLHFAETVFAAAGQRTFSVTGNGGALLNNLDVFAAAGGQTRPWWSGCRCSLTPAERSTSHLPAPKTTPWLAAWRSPFPDPEVECAWLRRSQ
jgi:hypothetical protein